MSTFTVRLIGFVYVEQYQDVEAETPEQALEKAYENRNNHHWNKTDGEVYDIAGETRDRHGNYDFQDFY